MVNHPWLIYLGTTIVILPIIIFAILYFFRADYRRITKELRLKDCVPTQISPFDKYSPPTLVDHAAEFLFHTDNRSRIYYVMYQDAQGSVFHGVCETASFRGVTWLKRGPYTFKEESR